ncbi:arylamine N-acetyltransferase [Streptomyces sp. NPDC090022]|uniref:arylamine N-acetyltransferase family protein n=1 Tax=Streptomyces sp. NPDC090022 TaxID=3365920 RepID=UPI0037FA58B4
MTATTRAALLSAYLRRLGTGNPGAPSRAGLFALQRAHLERVPYENIDIQLGRPPGIDPVGSARRIAAGRGGYCFHLNGAFALLLEALGYDVTRHIGGVCGGDADTGAERTAAQVNGNHLVLTVRVDGTAYFVDTGLGDGPYEPLPLREGTYRQGGFTYRMAPLSDGGGWTFHNEGGPCPVVDFRSAPATMADFAAEHVRLSTAEDSGFVRTLALLRRHRDGVDALRGRTLSRATGRGGPEGWHTDKRELGSREELDEVIAHVFGRALDDLTEPDRARLWHRSASPSAAAGPPGPLNVGGNGQT